MNIDSLIYALTKSNVQRSINGARHYSDGTCIINVIPSEYYYELYTDLRSMNKTAKQKSWTAICNLRLYAFAGINNVHSIYKCPTEIPHNIVVNENFIATLHSYIVCENAYKKYYIMQFNTEID